MIFHPYEEDGYEIGWTLNRSYWGKEITDELTEALVNYAKERGISSLIIECNKEQAVSKHIALKNGFTYAGEDADAMCTG